MKPSKAKPRAKKPPKSAFAEMAIKAMRKAQREAARESARYGLSLITKEVP